VQVPYDEGVANRIDPKSCAGFREGVCEAFQGSAQAKLLNRENDGRRRFACCGRQYGRARQRKMPARPGVVGELGMCGRSLYGNREISRSTKSDITALQWPASGRRSDFK
jgi:hypothetical protein